MSSASSVSSIATQSTCSSSTDIMPDRLQSATALGRFFCSSDKDLLHCGLPLLTLFTRRAFDVCLQATEVYPDFFSSMIKDLSENCPGKKHRFIQHLPTGSFIESKDYLPYRHTATCYIFARLFSDAIPDSPDEETDFSELIYLMRSFRRFHQDKLSSFLSQYEQGLEEIRKRGGHFPESTRERIEKHKKNLQFVIDFLELSSNALTFNDLELLKQTPLEIGIGSSHFTHTQHFRSTFTNFILVFLIMNDFHHVRVAHKELFATLPIFSSQKSFLTKNMEKIRQMLVLNKTISFASKVELFSHLGRCTNRIFNNDNKITILEGRMFQNDALDFYKGIVASSKAQAIAALNVSWNSNKDDQEASFCDLYPPTSSTPVFPEYAEQNRETIENFIPRLREAIGYISSKSNQIKKDLLICKHAPYFILKGDVTGLLARMHTARGNQAKIDAIIYRTMKEFSREATPAAGAIQPARTSAAPQNEFDQLEELFCSVRKIPKSLFSCQIERADEWNAHLFKHPLPLAPIRPSRVRLQHPIPLTASSEPQCTSSSDHAPAPSIVDTSSSSSSSASPTPTFHLETSSSSSSSDPSKPAFHVELEGGRRLLQRWMNNLASSRSPVTQSALKNSYEHFDNLFNSFRRIMNLSSQEAIRQRDLFSFVNDSVRHCNLGVEQLLSALFCETNGIKTKEALAPHLTHDLFQILHKCKMKDGDLPRDIRKWLAEINHGETIVRDIHLYSEKDTVLQNLLRANQRLVQVIGATSSSMEASHSEGPLFDALFNYLSPLGKLLQTIQDRFPVKKQTAPIQLEESFTRLIDSFCSEMEQVVAAPSQPLSDNTASVQLKEIRTLLESELGTAFNATLDNILQNLLVHLETEIESNAHLEPIEASLHLSNVLLLDQMIIEAVLIDSIHSKMLDLSQEEENQHDLLALVQKLQIEKCFSKEEIDFLKSGKTSRQFIRYPSSYSNIRSAKRPLSRLDKMLDLLTWGRTLANQQSTKEDLRGFTSGNREVAKRLQEVKAFAANDVRLLSSIVKKVLSKP